MIDSLDYGLVEVEGERMCWSECSLSKSSVENLRLHFHKR